TAEPAGRPRRGAGLGGARSQGEPKADRLERARPERPVADACVREMTTAAASKTLVEMATPISALSSRGQPALFRAVETQLDAVIAAAASLGRWTILEDAGDAKIDEQAEFVRWWDEAVRRPGGNTRSPIIV